MLSRGEAGLELLQPVVLDVCQDLALAARPQRPEEGAERQDSHTHVLVNGQRKAWVVHPSLAGFVADPS